MGESVRPAAGRNTKNFHKYEPQNFQKNFLCAGPKRILLRKYFYSRVIHTTRERESIAKESLSIHSRGGRTPRVYYWAGKLHSSSNSCPRLLTNRWNEGRDGGFIFARFLRCVAADIYTREARGPELMMPRNRAIYYGGLSRSEPRLTHKPWSGSTSTIDFTPRLF